jgi:flagellar M-ring protein FliF
MAVAETSSAPSGIMGQFSGLAQLQGLQSSQKFGLMLAAAAIIALLVGSWMWSQTPDYRVLYANVSDRDGGAIIGALEQMKVPYKFTEGGGAILIPGNQVHEVRLRLASQGLPKGGLVGFEVMENQKLGSSQFLEQVNYQRATEGELARSIQSLASVESARVHLAISKPSVFVRDQQKTSASVLLNLRPGRSLEPAQASAIVHLVSSSIPGLGVKDVTVVDQNGNLLSSQDSATLNAKLDVKLDAGQLKYVQELEQNYVKRIEAILSPITGISNVRAQVTADVDFARTERAEEIYRPNRRDSDTAAIRSQQSTETSSSGPQGPSGVPGALSNQPPQPATAPITTAAGEEGVLPAPSNIHKESTVNYEVDKTIQHIRQPLGGIKRLSVAVVVNYRKETDSEGKIEQKPLAAEEIAKINDLVKEAMGYSKDRGDTLNVVNSPFNETELEIIPEIPVWKDPVIWDWGKEIGKHLLIAAVLFYLIMGVLRPFLKNLAESRKTVVRHEAEEATKPSFVSYEEKLETAKQLSKEDPKVAAGVIKDWVEK